MALPNGQLLSCSLSQKRLHVKMPTRRNSTSPNECVPFDNGVLLVRFLVLLQSQDLIGFWSLGSSQGHGFGHRSHSQVINYILIYSGYFRVRVLVRCRASISSKLRKLSISLIIEVNCAKTLGLILVSALKQATWTWHCNLLIKQSQIEIIQIISRTICF